jgi:anaerobic magnesium-protoporphyrin IX monomethyl ester cyclase
MRFLLIYPSSGENEIFTGSSKKIQKVAFVPPLGLLYLGKALENVGHEVEIIDCCVQNDNFEKIRTKIFLSDAVGMTIYNTPREFNISVLLANFIKEINPTIPLIIGGPRVSLFPEDSIRQLNADIGVKGPGEFAITQIAEALEGKRDFSTIPGVYYKFEDKIEKSKLPNTIKNLDIVSFPARHLVNKYKYGYVFGTKLMKGKVTSILTSRGCPFNCSFCGLRAHIPHYQDRSSENVIKEIDEVIEQGYKTIVFVDDNFLGNKKKVEKIMDHFIQKDANIKIWIGDARADSADKNLYSKMRDAGVESISFGIESGNQDVLDFYNKKITISQIEETINLSNEMGFFIFANFIFGAPFETEEHFNNNINFIKSIGLDVVIIHNLCYPYGSQIYNNAIKEGKIKKDDISTVIADTRIGLGNFTTKELLKNISISYKKIYYDPRFIIREIRKAFFVKNFRFLKLYVKMFIK